MKRIFLLFLMLVPIYALAQETTSPLTDMEVVRKVAKMDIEGDFHHNVTVTLKSLSPDYVLSNKYRVKVTVVDEGGKKIWKKTLKNVFLYVFSNGQIQVGKKNFDQIVIIPSYDGEFTGKIREKEGVF